MSKTSYVNNKAVTVVFDYDRDDEETIVLSITPLYAEFQLNLECAKFYIASY